MMRGGESEGVHYEIKVAIASIAGQFVTVLLSTESYW